MSWFQQQGGSWYAPSAAGAYVGVTPSREWGGGYAGYGQLPLRPAYVGATPRRDWAGGDYADFGVMVPTPLPGQPGYEANMGTTGYNYCGSKYGFQQMLQDLGYYKGQIDGKVGTGTLSAAQRFAADHGAPWGGSLSNDFCAKLIQAWQAQMAPSPSPQIPRDDAAPKPSNGGPNGEPPKNGAPPAPVTNGNGAAGWWGRQSTGVKAAVVVGSAAVLGLIVYALVGGKKATPNRRRRYKPNRRRRRRLTKAQAASLKKIRGKRGRAPTGKITTLKSGKRYGHLKPPKRYWKMGARRPSDYADPEHYKYPLVFRNQDGTINRKRSKVHIRAAQSYFARNKRKYPPTVRRRIARNINKAKKRFDVGGKTVKP